MQEIENIAIETYTQNIEFLSQKHHKIFQKIKAFELQVENAEYLEKYSLEYLNGYFDVKQLSSQNYLYVEDSLKVSQQLTKAINYKKDSNIFDGFPLYYGYEKHMDTLEDKSRGLEGIYPMMTYYLDNIKTSSHMKMIEKFIFIGTGLGLHITQIDEKIKAEEYLIIEDDLELFRLSLFTTPYYKLGDRIIEFCIAQNDNDFTNTMNNFLNLSVFRNKFLKYSYFPAHSEKKIKLIQNSIASQGFISFPYKIYLNKLLRALDFINTGHSILNILKRVEISNISNKPALVIGAGPSLGKNIHWLKENQNKFTIIAVTSTLKLLSKHQIKPDIAVHLDGFNLALSLFDGFDAKSFLRDTIVILGSFTPYEITKYFTKENIFFTEEETCYNENFHTNLGPCVGSTSIMHALMLNIENIYTLGIDMAIDMDTGKSHTDSHITKDKIDTKDIDKLKNSMSFRGNFFPIKGNFKDTVFTNTLFQVSIQTLYNKLPKLKAKTQNIYNISDGAFLEHTLPQKIEDIEIETFQEIDKKSLHDELLITLKKHSKKVLSHEDVISLQKRADFAKEIKNIIHNYEKNTTYKNSEKFVSNILGLTLDIMQIPTRESLNLINVYDMFLSYVLPLIVDFFNTQDLKNEKKHMRKLNKMLVSEMYAIATIYEEKIEKFLAEKC